LGIVFIFLCLKTVRKKAVKSNDSEDKFSKGFVKDWVGAMRLDKFDLKQ
jgi:catalase (peroxidase I)